MFTGIVEEVGRVIAAAGLRLEVGCGFGDLGIGDSIAVNGVCLTVMELADLGDEITFAAEQGVTVIVVTHADNVAGWAHRRLAMRDGQLSDRADSEWKAPTAP